MGLNMGVYGLAWAAVIVSVVEVGILFYVMSRRIQGLFDLRFMNAVWRMASSAGFVAIITYIMVSMMPLGAEDDFMSSFFKFSLIVGISAVVYIMICRIFRLEEVDPILRRVKNILFKQPKVDS